MFRKLQSNLYESEGHVEESPDPYTWIEELEEHEAEVHNQYKQEDKG